MNSTEKAGESPVFQNSHGTILYPPLKLWSVPVSTWTIYSTLFSFINFSILLPVSSSLANQPISFLHHTDIFIVLNLYILIKLLQREKWNIFPFLTYIQKQGSRSPMDGSILYTALIYALVRCLRWKMWSCKWYSICTKQLKQSYIRDFDLGMFKLWSTSFTSVIFLCVRSGSIISLPLERASWKEAGIP